LLITTYSVDIGASWWSVGGQLAVSGLAVASGYQDLGLRARIGAAFSFFIAIAFGISALVTAIRANFPSGAAICAVVLCCETYLILRWMLRQLNKRNSQ